MSKGCQQRGIEASRRVRSKQKWKGRKEAKGQERKVKEDGGKGKENKRRVFLIIIYNSCILMYPKVKIFQYFK